MFVAESKRLTHQGAKTIMATAMNGRPGQHRDRLRDRRCRRACHPDRTNGRRPLPHRALLHHQGGLRRVKPAPDHGQGAAGQDLDVSHAIGLALAAGPERWTAMEGGVPVLVDRECIGGVGVSGGDWATDLRIAKLAVEVDRRALGMT